MSSPDLIQYKVFDNYGMEVFEQQMIGQAGINILSIPVLQFSGGEYYIDIRFGNVRKRSKFIKL